MIARRDFSYVEWSSLERLYRHEFGLLTEEARKRFQELEVTEQVGDGTGLSALGKRLVEHQHLMDRRNRLQR